MNNTFGSIVLYVICGLLCVLLAKHSDRRPYISFWAIVIILTLIAGLRSPSVGVDTAGYVEIIKSLQYSFRSHVSNVTEIGFLGISYLSMKYTGSYTCALLIFGFLINYFIIRRIFEERENASFPLAIYIFYCQYYFMTLNTIRQWVAIAFLFYFSKYIGKSKKGMIVYIAALFASVLFHKTAIIGVLLIAVYFLTTNSKKWYIQLGKISFIVLAPFIVLLIYNFFFSTYGAVYGKVITGSISFVNVLRLLLIAFIAITTHNEKARSRGLDVTNNEWFRIQSFNLIAYFSGTIITLCVLFYKYIDRVGLYFIIFELLVLPSFAKGRYKQFAIILIIALFTYLRAMSFAGNGYGELPYIPFWE